MNKLKSIEISAVLGVLVALVWGSGTVTAYEEMRDSLIRLHVVAHSDSEEDQAHKLAVRDAVVTMAEEWGEKASCAAEMEALLLENLTELEQEGERVLRERGCFHTVTAEVTTCYFPTKAYEHFALPAGTYTALRLVIGAGEGENWWCVAFPPLCVGAGAKSMEDAVQAGYFTPEQADFLAGEGSGYVLKFRFLELFGTLKESLLPP